MVSENNGNFKFADIEALDIMNIFCHQVKRLFDTFHEPFKRVEPSLQNIPETPAQNNLAGPMTSAQNDAEASLNEDKHEDVDDHVGKQRKKETELSVKSALYAAFVKYADRVGRKSNTSEGVEEEESSIIMESKVDEKKLL